MILRPGSREDSHLAYCLMLEGFCIHSFNHQKFWTHSEVWMHSRVQCISPSYFRVHLAQNGSFCFMMHDCMAYVLHEASSLGSYICFVSNPDLWIPHLVLLILLQDARIKKLSEDNLTQVLSLQEWGELVMHSRHKRRHFLFLQST